MDDIYIDLNFLTESERDILRDVLTRDEDFRRQEKRRLRYVNIFLFWFKNLVLWLIKQTRGLECNVGRI